jgi:uncharacterized membrane protein YuzA (DUF378 family)
VNHRLHSLIYTAVINVGTVGLFIFILIKDMPGLIAGLAGILVGLSTALTLVSWSNWSKSRIGGRW